MPNIPELTSIERRFYELNGELHCRAHQRWHCPTCYMRAKAFENPQLVVEPVETQPLVRPSLWALFIAVVTAVTLAGYFN